MSVADSQVVSSLSTAQSWGAESGVQQEHLVRLPGTQWSLWRSSVLRAPGFPAHIVDELAAPQASEAADRYLECQALAARQAEAAVRRITAETRGLPQRRAQIRAIRSAILAGKVEEAGPDAAAREAAEAACQARKAEEAFRDAYERESEAIGQRLAALIHNQQFREAMLWQNVDSTVRITNALRPDARPVRRRPALRQMAMRVQRYCVKNDSIGFFGPIGWAAVGENSGHLEVTPGAGLIAHREVFFEGWALDTLVNGLAADYDLRLWSAPRMKSGVWIEARRAYRPLRKPYSVSDAELTLLAMCNGRRMACEIAPSLVAANGTSFAAEEQVYETMQSLAAADVLAWQFEVESQLYPERELAERIAKIGDAAVRENCQAALDEMVSGRDRVALAAGCAADLEAALKALDESFTRLTAQPACRRSGQDYAGRTLIYEDCRRDGEVQVGASLLAELAQPLGIMLDAARWAAAEVGAVVRAHMRACLAELQQQGRGEIDCQLFVEYTKPTLWPREGRSTVFDTAVLRFQSVWERVLENSFDANSKAVVFPLDEVRARADEFFPPRDAGWNMGQYISPDLMISAASVEDIGRGNYAAVLGEIHGGNSIASSNFVSQHPEPGWLFRANAQDTKGEFVVLLQRAKSVWLARLNRALVIPRFWRYQFGDDAPGYPRCQPLPAGKLVVVDSGSTVHVQARDGSLRFDAIELFGPPLLDEITRMMAEFRPRLPHMPRVSLGNLTIHRERWNLSAGALPFRGQSDPARQFLEIRAWARAAGMPRRVFVSSPAERKPWFLDFDSPIYTEVFAANMRNLEDDAPIAIVEMLPDLEHLWLADAGGARFTSEFRFVARHEEWTRRGREDAGSFNAFVGPQQF